MLGAWPGPLLPRQAGVRRQPPGNRRSPLGCPPQGASASRRHPAPHPLLPSCKGSSGKGSSCAGVAHCCGRAGVPAADGLAHKGQPCFGTGMPPAPRLHQVTPLPCAPGDGREMSAPLQQRLRLAAAGAGGVAAWWLPPGACTDAGPGCSQSDTAAMPASGCGRPASAWAGSGASGAPACALPRAENHRTGSGWALMRDRKRLCPPGRMRAGCATCRACRAASGRPPPMMGCRPNGPHATDRASPTPPQCTALACDAPSRPVHPHLSGSGNAGLGAGPQPPAGAGVHW